VGGHAARAMTHRHAADICAEQVHEAGRDRHVVFVHGAVGKQPVVFLGDGDHRIAERQRHLRQGQKHSSDHEVIEPDLAKREGRQARLRLNCAERLDQRRVAENAESGPEQEQQEHGRDRAVGKQQAGHEQRRTADQPLLRHHLGAFDHEAKAQPQDDADNDGTRNEPGNVPRRAGQPEQKPHQPGQQAGAVDGGGSDDQRLRGLRGRNRTDRLHRLDREGRAIEQAAKDHAESEREKNAESVHFQYAHIGDHEWDQRAEVAESTGELHSVKPVSRRPFQGSLITFQHRAKL
jgi:hypothetical protein